MGIKIWWPLLFVATIILACVLIFPADLRLADLFGDAGRLDEAIKMYHKVLASQPDRADVRVHLAHLYVLNNEPDKAVAEFEAAQDLIDLDPIVLDQLYQLYSQLGNKEKTVTTLEKLVTLAPEQEHYRIKLAEAYEWNNDVDEAIANYERLLAEDPDNLGYLNKLTGLNLSKRNYAHCINYLSRTLALQPNDTDARILLGNIYLETNNKEAAASEFEKCLRLTPDHESLRVKLAELYLWTENYQKGILHYEYLLMHHILNDQYFDKLISASQLVDPPKAIKYFNFRLKYLPKNASLRERLIDLSSYLGFADTAIDHLNILIKDQPDQTKYQKQLATLFHNIQEPQRAAAVWEGLYKHGHLDAEVLDALLGYYQTEQQYENLVGLFASASTAGLADKEMLFQYANTLLAMKHVDQAISQYSNILNQHPEDSDARMELANLYAALGNHDAARDTFWRGIQDHNIYAEGYLLDAVQFFTEGKYYREALATHERLINIYPDNYNYKMAAVELYLKTKNFEKAASTYRQLLSMEPDNIQLRFQLASLYWLQDDLRETDRALREIKSLHAGQRHLERDIGQFYFERGFFSEAIEQLQFALATAPEDSATLRMLGLAYAWSNQPSQSKSILDSYHQLYPNDFYTHYQLGEIYLSERKKSLAFSEFEAAMFLAENAADDREALIVKGKVYAHQGAGTKSREQFERLLASYPDDESIYADYAEGLAVLKDYDESHYWLDQILQKDPNNYQALRLRSRNYYEQGKYKQAIQTLTHMQTVYATDVGVRMDLADAQLTRGDWYESEKTIKDIIARYPNTMPAEQRLVLLRRGQTQAFVGDYQAEEQSSGYLKQIYNFMMTKATSSLANFKVFIGEEAYSTNQIGNLHTEYQNLGVGVASRFSSKLETALSATAQRHIDHWNFSGTGLVGWHFNAGNSFEIAAATNELWRDPIIAAFQEGRLNSVQTSLNLSFFRRVFFWNQLRYERHSTRDADHFGEALRTSALVGFNWSEKPLLSTYYQFYKLKYTYQDPANRVAISIPDRETIHYLGANLNQQLSKRFFYQLGASIGMNTDQNNLVYYGSIDLEYMLLNQLRLRSHLTYGSLNRLAGNENVKAVKFDLYYFY